ncbi:serine/threonine-protein kinase [Streptomyces sp. 150FB]|uniref:serine/threonine-protein kinase n=1 Tax=Streptomyces sp. 150FB TaxID=1576605 RepID=UPI0006991829|nr:serine/threonine-protein kinase [Streptomyces sp. 150FB]
MRALEHGDPHAVGRFSILARIGAGGMAVIYLGRSAGGWAVAVKMMHREFAQEQRLRDRFRSEIEATRAAGGLYSPAVLDADPDAMTPWLVTEFLPSVSLDEAVRRFGPFPAASVRTLAAGLAEALASIHSNGIVHLDLKPANVLLTADGPRLIDFGIADLAGTTPAAPREAPAGSQGFMSPEQMTGGEVGPASDVFSLGATLAWARTGPHPGTPHDGETPTPPAGPIADDELRATIESCLRPDPGDRPLVSDLVGQLPHSNTPFPPEVLAEIDRQESAAANPPVDPTPAPPRPPTLPDHTPSHPEQTKKRRPLSTRRRVLLALAALVVGSAAVVGIVRGASEDNGGSVTAGPERRTTPTVTPPPSAKPTPSPSAKPRAMQFLFTGDTKTLATLTYTVNGRATTLKNVKLPWQETVDIPPLPKKSTWKVKFTYPPGNVRFRLLVDGFQLVNGANAAAGLTGKGSGEGKA